MKYETLKSAVLKKQKGAFSNIVWERTMKTKKAFAHNIITKRCSAVVRFGIKYDNIASVRQSRASGVLPAVNAGLPWGEWLMQPYFIQHKGSRYLRCTESKGNSMEVEYYLNGGRVPKGVIETMCLKSEFSDHGSMEVFNINVDNIISIR